MTITKKQSGFQRFMAEAEAIFPQYFAAAGDVYEHVQGRGRDFVTDSKNELEDFAATSAVILSQAGAEAIMGMEDIGKWLVENLSDEPIDIPYSPIYKWMERVRKDQEEYYLRFRPDLAENSWKNLGAQLFLPPWGTKGARSMRPTRQTVYHGTHSGPSVLEEGWTTGGSAELGIPGTSLSEDMTIAGGSFSGLSGSGGADVIVGRIPEESMGQVRNLRPSEYYAMPYLQDLKGQIKEGEEIMATRKPQSYYREAETFVPAPRRKSLSRRRASPREREYGQSAISSQRAQVQTVNDFQYAARKYAFGWTDDTPAELRIDPRHFEQAVWLTPSHVFGAIRQVEKQPRAARAMALGPSTTGGGELWGALDYAEHALSKLFIAESELRRFNAPLNGEMTQALAKMWTPKLREKFRQLRPLLNDFNRERERFREITDKWDKDDIANNPHLAKQMDQAYSAANRARDRILALAQTPTSPAELDYQKLLQVTNRSGSEIPYYANQKMMRSRQEGEETSGIWKSSMVTGMESTGERVAKTKKMRENVGELAGSERWVKGTAFESRDRALDWTVTNHQPKMDMAIEAAEKTAPGKSYAYLVDEITPYAGLTQNMKMAHASGLKGPSAAETWVKKLMIDIQDLTPDQWTPWHVAHLAKFAEPGVIVGAQQVNLITAGKIPTPVAVNMINKADAWMATHMPEIKQFTSTQKELNFKTQAMLSAAYQAVYQTDLNSMSLAQRAIANQIAASPELQQQLAPIIAQVFDITTNAAQWKVKMFVKNNDKIEAGIDEMMHLLGITD